MKIIYILIIIIFLLNSCESNPYGKQIVTDEILKAKITFRNNYLDHFPNKAEGFRSLLDVLYEEGEEGQPHVFLLETFSIFNYDSKLKPLLSKSIAVYPANQECLYVIDPFRTRENEFSKYPLAQDTVLFDRYTQKCYFELYPIPNFYMYYSDEDKKDKFRLPEDFKIYVIEAKQGLFHQEKFLLGDNNLPYPWTHGYSKGFAASNKRKTIIYWFIIW